MTTVTFTGRHPYLGFDATVEIPVHDALPGVRIADRHNSTKADQVNGWVALAGYYQPEKSRMESNALISLLWDLLGLPITHQGSARPKANFLLLSEPSGIVVYRAASEMVMESQFKLDGRPEPGGPKVATVRRLAGKEAE
jgi:hypothetical protein